VALPRIPGSTRCECGVADCELCDPCGCSAHAGGANARSGKCPRPPSAAKARHRLRSCLDLTTIFTFVIGPIVTVGYQARVAILVLCGAIPELPMSWNLQGARRWGRRCSPSLDPIRAVVPNSARAGRRHRLPHLRSSRRRKEWLSPFSPPGRNCGATSGVLNSRARSRLSQSAHPGSAPRVMPPAPEKVLYYL